MTAISTAVGNERVARIVGYKLLKGNFAVESPNLPQRIAILAEANTANQSGLTVNPDEITTAKEAGDTFGYGSPIHQIMRILKPTNGDGVGGIPIVVYPQLEAAGATATIITSTATVSSAADDNNTHYLVINGRDNIDGQYYNFNVVVGDTKATIVAKMIVAVNAVLGCPFIATQGGGTGTETFILTSKWKGVTAAERSLVFDTNGNDCGVTYSTSANVAGTGATTLANTTPVWGSSWNTIVINSYGTAAFSALESFNGVPDPTTPTGKYAAINFKPFISIWGSIEGTAATLIAITDAAGRKSQVTHALAPAPLSTATTWEAAANMAYLFAINSQNTPHLDVNGKSYPDMPVPSDEIIEDFSSYDNRDALVKAGCSTVNISAGKYVVEDFVTTYHPDGETPPQFRYCRNLMLDFNVRYGYYLLELVNVLDHTIIPSGQITNVSNTIRPKEWKQILNSYADDLAARALLSDAEFMKANITVEGDGTNPDRLNTQFKYKRTGVARICSTDAVAGFNFNVQ
jgi:phage tail sheath gpL-like